MSKTNEQITKSLKTKNINKAIGEFAYQNSIEVSKCDFKINAVQTFVRDITDSDYSLFSGELKSHYADKEHIINEHIEFSQTYNITIFALSKRKIKLIYKIAYDDYSTHPKIIISPNSYIPYKLYNPKELLSLLYRELNKIKAKNNILINLFDETMINTIKLLVKYIYSDKFKKNIKIPLFEGIAPEIAQESRLIIRFLQKENKNQVIEVEKDEVLADFYKPQFGKNGLDCHGKEVNSGSANNKEDLQQEIDENSIRIEEDEKKKQYISRTKGFVKFSNTHLAIDNKIRMEKLSRLQDSLASEEKNNIEIAISQYDTNKDSVGEGVELVSETVHINGHVGANSIIEAQNLTIDGATHQDSMQFAKNALINRHKGTLRCNKAEIKLLEGGTVHATKVDIDACLGGYIYAQDVNISHVKNNLKVYASNSITIKLISGEDNRLKINYKEIPILVSKIELIKEEIEDLNFSLEEALKQNSQNIGSIKENIKSLKEEVSEIVNSAKNAKISIEKPLHGLNNIIFTIDDEHEISFKTEALQYTPFYLEISEDKITLHPTEKTISIES